MALMIPVIMAGGSIIGRIATTRLAQQLAGNLLRGYKIARKPASEVKGVPKITSINQAKNLKPATKVAGKKPTGSMQTGAPSKPKPKSQPLRADPKKAPDAVKKRLADKNKKPSVFGTKGQKRIVTGGLTAASLATMIPKKDTGKATAKTTNKGTPIQEDLGSGRRNAKPKKETTAPKKDKFSGEPRTIAQAKKMGKSYFINKAGKKLAAVSREDLKRKGLDPSKKSDLTKFLNMKRKKK